MDLIYMNANKEDLGVLQDYELDLAFGSDENNFECTIHAGSHCCEAGYYLYAEGTEYGGIIDSISNDTDTNDVTYSGRTWHGILQSKVILPLQENEEYEGEVDTDGIRQEETQLFVDYGVTVTQVSNMLFLDSGAGGVEVETENANGTLVLKYLVLSGDANSCIQFIIDRVGLSGLFKAPAYHSGVTINKYQFNRYTDVYSGLSKMLKSAGLKLKTTFQSGKVVLSAVAVHDYSQDEEFDSGLVGFRSKKNFRSVNHLICLGSGELENRMVVHLYADEKGNISQTQTLFGMDEYTAVYDYSSMESEEELILNGTAELAALWGQDELQIALDDNSDVYGIGDVVGAYDHITKIAVASAITKKIVTVKNGIITISYEVGE